MKPFGLVIVGPTGAGKTNFSLQIARLMDGEIISADSRQIYRGMDIGTDKIDPVLRSQIPHYLIDIIEPDEYYSSGRFMEQAREACLKIVQKGKLPILVGGAGLYIRAFFDGLFSEPVKDINLKNRIRSEVSNQGNDKAYAKLLRIDPEYAHAISPADSQRLVRALEIYEATGKIYSEYLKMPLQNFNADFYVAGIIRDRKTLFQRINRRVLHMLDRGFVDEVRRLKDQGYHAGYNAMQTVGYREIYQYLDGDLDYEEMVRLIQKRSRHYAKRQITWFKKDSRVHWYPVEDFQDEQSLSGRIGQDCHTYLSNQSIEFRHVFGSECH